MQPICLLCGEKTSPLSVPHMKSLYHVCDGCQLIAKDRACFISAEEELAIYSFHQNSIDDPRYVAYFNRFLERAVFPFVQDGSGRKGFDYGSGPSPVLAQILERDYGYQMDIYDLFYAPEKTFEGKEYDLITCTEVVEHLQDPLTLFQLFHQLLKPDGILAVMTQFHHNDLSHFQNWHYVRDRSHIAFYTPATMEYLANQAGLKVLYTDSERYTTFHALCT